MINEGCKAFIASCFQDRVSPTLSDYSLGCFVQNYFSFRTEKLLLYLPGQTCPDPLSCPVCASVFSDPISLPCGHSYCRKCIAKTPALKTSCLKCGSNWRPSDGLEPSEAGIEEKDIISHLKQNVLVMPVLWPINSRVWSQLSVHITIWLSSSLLANKGGKRIQTITKAGLSVVSSTSGYKIPARL